MMEQDEAASPNRPKVLSRVRVGSLFRRGDSREVEELEDSVRPTNGQPL